VRDNGIGFDAQYSERVFRVFERLHGRGAYPGTGIGLALCRKIADRHGGSVTVESTLGQGSVFTVTLPLHPPQPVTEGPAPSAPGEPIEQEEPYVAV
jgi:signal transduction histidine kinase